MCVTFVLPPPAPAWWESVLPFMSVVAACIAATAVYLFLCGVYDTWKRHRETEQQKEYTRLRVLANEHKGYVTSSDN